jgi:hypothetical protein
MGATTALWYNRTSGVGGVLPGKWRLSVKVGDSSLGGLAMARPGGDSICSKHKCAI